MHKNLNGGNNLLSLSFSLMIVEEEVSNW